MRGGKCTPWEGGTRPPRSGGGRARCKPADVDRLAAHIDVFPTLAELAGATVPRTSPPSSTAAVSCRSCTIRRPTGPTAFFSPMSAAGRKGQAAASKYLQCRVRNGRYSLVCDTEDGSKKWELFDLKTDYGEKNDMAAEHPEIVKQLEAAYDRGGRKSCLAWKTRTPLARP